MPKPNARLKPSPWVQLVHNRQFIWLLLGNVAMFFGFSATLLLRSLLAWKITGDEMSLAWINLVAAGCMFFTSIFAGAVIDRVERRRMMLIAQTVLLAAEGSVLVLLVMDRLTFGFLLVSAFAVSTTFPFIMPARTAMVVESVGRASFGKASAMMSGGVNISRMVSPAAVGFIADWWGLAQGYLSLVAVHAIALWCTFNVKRSYPVHDPQRGAIFSEIREGFAYISRNRPLALCLLFGILPVLIVVPFQNMMVVFVEELWGQGGSGLGIMLAAMGVGGLLGSVLMAMIKDGSLMKPMIVATVFMGIFLILLSHSPWFWLAVIIMFGIYSSSVLTQILVHTGVQLMSEDRYRGRITTISLMTFGLAPVGTFPLAFATKHIGASLALTAAAVILLICVTAIWFLLPSFRKIDEAARAY
ncbi:MAG: MFS transporter [Porticoccaceae bacterium]